jgi:alkylation response protein AidB-like acyl-CoA dehydrogenase|tara:strand:- start:98 stop:1321 length:1224 start_codon:yes stop_codon:yes gene_type:complete
MSYPDLDVGLTEEDIAARDMVRRFGMEVMRPIGIRLDKLADPQQVIDADSELWDVHRTYRELGLHSRRLPGTGGAGLSPLGGIAINEELGYADSGLAISIAVAGAPFAYAAASRDDELRGWAKAYAEDTKAEMIGCWAITEPDHGSDWILAGEPSSSNPAMAPQLKAVKKGKEYILTGQKSAWVSNGTIATHASLHVSLDPDQGMHGTAVCILPLDLPGISKGKPLDKHGQRALNQGEIFFEEVVIPEKYMVVPDIERTNVMLGYNTWAGANTGMSVTFAGCAKSALDEAIDYAKQRVQGGVPIVEHQNIKLKLMHMLQMVEAARSLSRRTMLYNMANPPGSLSHAVAAKALSTETAFNVASEAVQIHGGNGLSKEYVIEKIMRDARASMIEDGTNEALLLRGAAFL